MRAYDSEGIEHAIGIVKERDHYVINVDGDFYCSCDNHREVDEEIPAVMEVYNFSYFKEG